MKKLLPLIVVGFLIIGSFGAVGIQINKEKNVQKEKSFNEDEANIEYKSSSFTKTIQVSEPDIVQDGNYVLVEVNEASSMLLETGKPIMPVITKTYTFQAGTRIDNTEITIDWDETTLSKEIKPSPAPEALTLDPVTYDHERKEKDESVYSSTNLYPSDPYTVRIGSGINDGEHVLYFNVRCNAQYSPANDLIKVPKTINIDIDYEEPNTPLFGASTYDLIIITHDKFEGKMQELATYKESKGFKTKVVTVDEIYSSYNGVADWEEIKMYLADKVKAWGVDYVLLAGGRKGQTHEWYVPDFPSHNFDGAYAGDVPYDETYSSDLYFADVYYADQYGYLKMDDWDSNGNGIYAEGPYYEDFDKPDYYPDVYLGRIPLRYSWEADIIVDKIKEYDSKVSPSWFKKCVLVGGDTTPPARYEQATEGVYEGELACDVTGDHLGDIGFDVTKCYTSNNGDIVVREPEDVEPVISQGCGWVNMQTHSNPAVCGNFNPDALTEGDFSYFYTIFDVRNFDNDGKYPLFVVDGCHSGQFNVALQQVIDAGGLDYPRSNFLEFTPTDISSWALLQGNGGSIGSIGVSGLGYGYVNTGITQGLGGWIMPRFAHAYADQGIEYLGEIWAQGIIDYIDIIGNINSDEIDRKTIEERVFFGDPTVRLGGGMSGPPENKEKNREAEDIDGQPKSLTISSTPTWNVGQEWTYKLSDLDLSIHEVEGRDLEIHLSAGDLNLKVEDTSGDTYDLAVMMSDIEGTLDINFDPYTEEEPTIITFEIPPDTTVTGNAFCKKGSLDISKMEASFDIKLDVQELLDEFNVNLPSIMVRILFPDGKMPVTADLVFDFDDPYTLIQFPLAIDNEWGIEQGVISVDGVIKSKYFNLLKLVNNIFGIFGIELLPEEFAKYLPEIDVSEFLSDQEMPTELEVAEIDRIFRGAPFNVAGMKQVSTDAGTFNSYTIEFLQGSGEIYYSDQAENIVKIKGNIEDFIPIAENIEMELTSYK